MEPKAKYICINRPQTSDSHLFHRLSKSQVYSNFKFVIIQFLCNSYSCLHQKFGNTLEHQRIFIMAKAAQLLHKMSRFIVLMLVIVNLVSMVEANRFGPFGGGGLRGFGPFGGGGFGGGFGGLGPFGGVGLGGAGSFGGVGLGGAGPFGGGFGGLGPFGGGGLGGLGPFGGGGFGGVGPFGGLGPFGGAAPVGSGTSFPGLNITLPAINGSFPGFPFPGFPFP
jgi:hypothetical protein